jgi:hypothetical protein
MQVFWDVLRCAVRSASGFGDVLRCAVRSVKSFPTFRRRVAVCRSFGEWLRTFRRRCGVPFVPVVVPDISQNRGVFILRLKYYKAE